MEPSGAKGSRSSVHPMKPDEKVLARRELPASDYVFPSERAERMTRTAFWRVVAQAGERAGLAVHAYAHLLRHSCGYYLANKGSICVSSRTTWDISRSRIRCDVRRSIQPDSQVCGNRGIPREIDEETRWPRNAVIRALFKMDVGNVRTSLRTGDLNLG
jgi:hypothetical protein